MKTTRIYMAMFLVTSVFILADWYPGDPYKMHYPQLPDPTGWDVLATAPKVLADDWVCRESGPVSDVHLWGSWRQDMIGQISNVHLSIHNNLLPDTTTPYSRPGDLLWEQDFRPDQFIVRPYGIGDQGWYNPQMQEWIRPDHMQYHQINIKNIQNPFRQIANTIYWLDVSVTIVNTTPESLWGWKTTKEHFMDDAVWADYTSGTIPVWRPLEDPSGVSLDLAFVITPEPATLVLLVLGGAAALRSQKR